MPPTSSVEAMSRAGSMRQWDMIPKFALRTAPHLPPALAFLALLLTLHPAAAENIEVTGTLSATASAEVPWPAGETSINVTGPDSSQDGAVVRAAFIAELQARGYTIDIAGVLDADLSWGGDFGRAAPDGGRPRFSLQGEGGNRSDPNIGLSLRLGAPPADDPGYLYVLNCRVFAEGGEAWHGQAQARTSEPIGGRETGKLAKVLSVQLIEAFGRSVEDAAFTATLRIP